MQPKKLILFLILLVQFSNILFSQANPSFFSIRFGSSLPTGKFAGYDLKESSFTMPGITFSADGGWFFLPYLGVGAQVGYNLHPINVGLLGYEKMKADPFIQDLTIRSDPFQTITVTAGIYGKWNFWKSFSLNGNISGGWIWAKTPYQLYKPTYFMVESKWYEITSSKDNGFIAVPGVGFAYDFKSCIGLKVNAEYYYKKMSFGFTNNLGTYYLNKTISFVNLTLGVVVFL